MVCGVVIKGQETLRLLQFYILHINTRISAIHSNKPENWFKPKKFIENLAPIPAYLWSNHNDFENLEDKKVLIETKNIQTSKYISSII